MKRFWICAAVVALALPSMDAARGANVRFDFNASDFMNVTATVAGTAIDQASARRVRAFNSSGSVVALYSTWTQQPGGFTGDVTPTSPYNTWKNTLSAGEGIAEFSIWLEPVWFGGTNAAAANNYGAILGYDGPGGPEGNNMGQVLFGGGPEGWNFTVASYVDGGMSLPLPTWYTTDPSKYLRPGVDLGNTFYFAANLAEFNTGGVKTSDAIVGKDYRLWFWSDSLAESLSATGLPTEIVLDAGSSFPGVNNPNPDLTGNTDKSHVDFRAFLNATASVPEPSTLAMLLALGGMGLLGCLRRRRRR